MLNDRDVQYVSMQGHCVTRDDLFWDQRSQNICMGTHCFGTSHHIEVTYVTGPTNKRHVTLIKMEREIFFLGNLFSKYEELAPYL